MHLCLHLCIHVLMHAPIYSYVHLCIYTWICVLFLVSIPYLCISPSLHTSSSYSSTHQFFYAYVHAHLYQDHSHFMLDARINSSMHMCMHIFMEIIPISCLMRLEGIWCNHSLEFWSSFIWKSDLFHLENLVMLVFWDLVFFVTQNLVILATKKQADSSLPLCQLVVYRLYQNRHTDDYPFRTFASCVEDKAYLQNHRKIVCLQNNVRLHAVWQATQTCKSEKKSHEFQTTYICKLSVGRHTLAIRQEMIHLWNDMRVQNRRVDAVDSFWRDVLVVDLDRVEAHLSSRLQ